MQKPWKFDVAIFGYQFCKISKIDGSTCFCKNGFKALNSKDSKMQGKLTQPISSYSYNIRMVQVAIFEI